MLRIGTRGVAIGSSAAALDSDGVYCIHELPEGQCAICKEGHRPRVTRRAEYAVNAHQRWTDDDDVLVKELFNEGKSVAEIAAQLGRSEPAISARRQRHLTEHARCRVCEQGILSFDTGKCGACDAEHRWLERGVWIPV